MSVNHADGQWSALRKAKRASGNGADTTSNWRAGCAHGVTDGGWEELVVCKPDVFQEAERWE